MTSESFIEIIKSFEDAIVDEWTTFNVIENDDRQNLIVKNRKGEIDIHLTFLNAVRELGLTDFKKYLYSTANFASIYDHWQQMTPEYLIDEGFITNNELKDLERKHRLEFAFELAIGNLMNMN